MKGKNKMKTIEAKNCMLEAYNRMGELVDAIGIINADTSKENSKEERHDNSNMDEFIISILCVELNELIEKLKNKL
tara:strand:- start:774 stop:1001 length:228 start_codon:yes stop_codon:yes gene_type:complete